MRGFIPLFIIVPVIELLLLVYSWNLIGFPATFLIIILTGIIGGYLARKQGKAIWNQLKVELSSGIMPGNTILEGIVVLIGGILLLTPGYLSDLTGFLLLIPFIRRKARNLIYFWLKKQYDNGRVFFSYRKY